MDHSTNLIEAAAVCLRETDPACKCRAVELLNANPPSRLGAPVPVKVGRPDRPLLVNPRDLPRRKLSTQEGHAAFIHAICHIEFTAINLALDAVVRFGRMPGQYYTDWLAVAAEEAIHFSLLAEHLGSFGFRYGDFFAHDGLWDMAERTSDDVLRRMALVPRVMEARGLDVTPNMVVRLKSINDLNGASILQRILTDEVGHVRVGSDWFSFVCEGRGLDPVATFVALVNEHFGAVRAAKLNRPARLAAGFSELELDLLAAQGENLLE